MRFLKTLIGSLIGKLLAGLILASLAVIGFGPGYWVHALIGWAADPLNLTLNVARLIFVLVGIVLIAILLLPPDQITLLARTGLARKKYHSCGRIDPADNVAGLANRRCKK